MSIGGRPFSLLTGAALQVRGVGGGPGRAGRPGGAAPRQVRLTAAVTARGPARCSGWRRRAAGRGKCRLSSCISWSAPAAGAAEPWTMQCAAWSFGAAHHARERERGRERGRGRGRERGAAHHDGAAHPTVLAAPPRPPGRIGRARPGRAGRQARRWPRARRRRRGGPNRRGQTDGCSNVRVMADSASISRHCNVYFSTKGHDPPVGERPERGPSAIESDTGGCTAAESKLATVRRGPSSLGSLRGVPADER